MTIGSIISEKVSEILELRHEITENERALRQGVDIQKIKKVLLQILELFEYQINTNYINYIEIHFDGVGRCYFKVSSDGIRFYGKGAIQDENLVEALNQLDEIVLNSNERYWIHQSLANPCYVVEEGGCVTLKFLKK